MGLDEIRTAATLPTGCGDCDNGCNCQPGTPGCEHFGCCGDDATNSCPHAEPWLTALEAEAARTDLKEK